MTATLQQGLIDYLRLSPSPFHATKSLAQLLEAQGYQRLLERDTWQLKRGGRYFVTRNDSALIAWQMGEQDPSESGIRLVGAHTDSPCLKVKPNPELLNQGYWQLGVEVYGGVLLAPWFDRDLSLAGRVTFRKDGAIDSRLVDFQRAIAVVPNLAIHLNREANDSQSINKQTDLPPLLACISGGEAPDFRSLLAERIEQEHGLTVDQVLDYEMNFYDTHNAAVIGLENDFIAGARLDNLLSCFAGAQALINAADAQQWSMLVCTDHEEVGSSSHCGADGPMLEQVLRRVLGDDENFTRAIQRSILISADNAHGIHPNYPDRHDGNHGPRLNQGPVIKINHNQRYASTSETSGLFRQLCLEAEVPVQSFVVRSDMACGSTIGPITSSQVGVRTVDIGVPTFAMHSIRELAGSHDLDFLVKVLSHFYRLEQLP
ncbi:M18 family aminopeptidase [Atopomonas sediminilitoris]|uniref:M18 family aminopeptidase n=1 Tax=Atopomonas sediminilitoris TaxID=2919919 RepID=UPI001F4EE9D9|nr:M18 family aminopeptidase [Atopomonas sediminilitoris]MCJ8170088.1 M18 family aminopeptidase [Atopomonas sediminilitoris]